MKKESLSRYEELAGKVMSNADDEKRLNGLNGLLSKMQNEEPVLFGVVKNCGKYELQYSQYGQTSHDTARYFVEAYDSFREYEADTPEQAKNRMQQMELQLRQNIEYPKYQTTEKVETDCGSIEMRVYNELSQYNQTTRWKGGYYSYWLHNKDKFHYRLLCGLLDNGFGVIADSTKKELLNNYCIQALKIPANLQPLINSWDEAVEDADRAAEELRIAASAAYLWLAIHTERDLLQEERSMYGLGNNAQPTIPDNLRTQEANQLLSVIEKVSIEVKGKGLLPLLDRTTLPWRYASRAGLRAVAEVTRGLIIGVEWHDFEIACDFKSLQSAPERRIAELEKALDDAGYKNYYKK